MEDYENIRPSKGVVFARVLEREQKVTAQSLIILPATMHGRPNRARVEFAPPGAQVKPGEVVCFDAYKIRLVMAHGQLANGQGTPLANPGERFAIDEDDIFFVEDDDGEEE